ncbi:hypothetical protein MPSEU_000301300 [Mayamaea pseudoterrestris]|nr:hypothetical protein MPSEU_000301300 [Mayamaea pseudoterrestris]
MARTPLTREEKENATNEKKASSPAVEPIANGKGAPPKVPRRKATNHDNAHENGTSTTSRKTEMNGSKESISPEALSSPSINEATTIPSQLPLVPSFVACMRAKESMLSLQSWVTLALTLDGRDKMTKLLQYLSRLAAYLVASSKHSSQAKRFVALKVSLTNSRKAFRLGRTLIELHRLKQLKLWESFIETCRVSKLADAENDTPSQLSLACRAYQSILSHFASFFASTDNTASTASSTPFLMVLGSAVKLLGLAGFWAGDNVNYLTMSKLFDNYQSNDSERRMKRMQLQSKAAVFANRSYFMGSLAGLYVSWRAYYRFRRQQQSEQAAAAAAPDSNDSLQSEQTKAKQFALFTMLLKSICDVLVFSNNPGLDLWQTYRGRKMHEGFHCLCGLTSAATVLYNNFPDAKK